MHRAEPGTRRRPESTLLEPPVRAPDPELYRGPGRPGVRLLPAPEPRRLWPFAWPAWYDVAFLLVIAAAIVALALRH